MASTISHANRLLKRETGALCNDFSEALYYIEHFPGSPGWVVYFEGGGGCSSFEECNQRWLNMRERRLMSSVNFPQEISGSDILSSNPSENPLFHNYSHVVVPYCSSDAWLANRSNLFRFSIAEFSESIDADNFVYKGRVIFQAVFEELLGRWNLSDARELILVGSSAGGIGILNNIGWVEERLQNESINILTIIDSSWFIPFNGYHAVSWSERLARDLNINQEACLDYSLGFPCCTSPSCLFTKGYLPDDIPPILAISSIYDIFTLEGPLRNNIQTIQTGEIDDQALLRLLNSYGALMNQSFTESYNSYSNLTLYTSSCTQHVYLATSSLWGPGGVLNETSDGAFQEGVFQLTNPVQSGNWEQVNVVNQNQTTLTLHEAIQNWYHDPTARFHHTDKCSGPVCGICPSEITLEPPRNVWPTGANIVVLVLSAFLTALPASLKLGAYFHMKYMLYHQRVYAYSVKQATRSKPHFPKAVHAVSVSCTDLHYEIDVVNKPKAANEGHYLQSSEQYRFYTKLEIFLPCFKRLCWRCLMRYKAPVCDPSNNAMHPSERLRSDSGISSSITLNVNRNIQTGTTCSPNNSSGGETVDTNSLVSNQSDANRGNIKKMTILNRVNMYVNPGELMAVMGPSGSGKTTLLDVLLGRRSAGSTEGDIFINGFPLSKMRNWFVVNTGYVRQLATSYYGELTVRENLLFSMNMQASPGMQLDQKLERVEQVIRETGLLEQADVRVGDGTGLGLSGGQRKRLAIAVQLLSMPNIIFLDEPTSGLDSASSLEILKSLQVMAGTGRAIVVTIHQPRSEIFHAFDKILLLCKGQVAFFGSPFRVWDFFLRVLEEEMSATELKENEGKSRADAILDLLKEKKSQQRVLHAYRESTEPKKIQAAILEGRDENDIPPPPMNSRYPGLWSRLVSMESRASLRQNVFSTIYLPIVYVIFGTILGTTYLFTDYAVQIMSVTCLLSCSSSLFMSSIVMSLLIEPLKLFHLEHSDGIACAHELILQVFIRMSAVCTLPLAVCATIIFGLVFQNYDFQVYVIILLAFLLVNQAWISLFIVLTVTYPQQAHRMCPVFAAIGGFCCGFIVPRPLMPEYYRWIFNINPSFYAYAATTVVVLDGNDLGCTRDSPLECFRESGVSVLDRFGLDDVNPMLNLVILMAMIIIFVTLGVIVLQMKITFPLVKETLMRVFCVLRKWRKKKRRRVHSSWEALEGGQGSDPVALRALRRGTFFEGTDSQHDLLRYSPEFLEQGEHVVFHTFPWERPAGEVEATDGGYMVPSSTPLSPKKGDGKVRVDSGEVDLNSEVIEMEERDEEERRRLADWKWEQRRKKMETEFLRLKHFSRTVDRVRNRTSVTLHNADVDVQQLQLQLQSDAAGGNQMRRIRSSKSTLDHGPPGPQPPSTVGYNRSFSVPAHRGHNRRFPSLETHQEEEEEDIIMGLPPKDVPNIGESMENLDRLQMNDIPQEVVDLEWNIEEV